MILRARGRQRPSHESTNQLKFLMPLTFAAILTLSMASSWPRHNSSTETALLAVDETNPLSKQESRVNNNRKQLKRTLDDLWQHDRKLSNYQEAIKTNPRHNLNSKQRVMLSRAAALQSSSSRSSLAAAATVLSGGIEGEYRCAKYCTCSLIQVLDRGKGVNLTRASCESALFADLLTIDRRTQIIHISLPAPSGDNNKPANEHDEQSEQATKNGTVSFRMPRLVQFSGLREIVIENLKFEVCDSEVFKRGQKLRRLQLNGNQLSRISKACLRHLDKLLELNLDHNQLEELESALFNSLLSLRSLSLAHNRLSELAAHQFANLTNLVSLNLVGNLFTSINLYLLEPMQVSLKLLVLADNQIKSFVYAPLQQQQQQQSRAKPPNGSNSSASRQSVGAPPFAGVLFKNLLKLNADRNRFERVKSLQLHRFYNVKFLSIRQNLIATIRDKAFNGLKLIELNLARNQLQSVSKCAFCNATVRRLVLAHNNITLPLPSLLVESGAQPINAALLPIRPFASVASNEPHLHQQHSTGLLPEQAAQTSLDPHQLQPDLIGSLPSASSSQSMLILSQSIFGPLIGQLEYLDLSGNEQLANQLDYLLEPLLNLEYLNIANVGLDRSLPSPNLFKNLRQLRYLNMSHNQLDQVIAETVEPLSQLEVLDMSHNKFSELEETFLVATDELSSLKLINLSSNPWFCSQCKVAPLYDWILRSAIYNSTCIAATALLAEQASSSASETDNDRSSASGSETGGSQQPNGLVYTTQSAGSSLHDYSLLIGDELTKNSAAVDLDLFLGSASDDDLLGSYNLLGDQNTPPAGGGDLARSPGPSVLASSTSQHLAMGIRDLAIDEDDESIVLTMSAANTIELRQAQSADYCLKCEFPGELHGFNLHELSSGDFKFCAGAAPRFAASEPKLGLTLAIVIIGAFICIIIVVILMYRKKSNTYYTNEDTDQLQTSKKPGLSVSSDVERQYGDGTDYSSPPMSQSFESYTSSQEDEEADLGEEDLNEEDEEDEVENEDDDDEVLDEEEEDVEIEPKRPVTSGERSQVHLGRLGSAEQERRQQVADYERRQNSRQSQSRSGSGESHPTGAEQQQRATGNKTTAGPTSTGAGRNGSSPAKKSQSSMQSNHSLKFSTPSSVLQRPQQTDAKRAPGSFETAGKAIEHLQQQAASLVPSSSRPPVVGRVKSSQSAGSQTQPTQSNQAKRLDSSGPSSGSGGGGSSANRKQTVKADEPSLHPETEACLGRERARETSLDSSGAAARQPAKSNRPALSQLAAGLRPQSSGGAGTHRAGTDSPSALSGVHSAAVISPSGPMMMARQHQTTGGAGHRLQRAGQLGRQRFALSKDLSQAAIFAGTTIARSEDEAELDEAELLRLEQSALRADMIATQARQMTRTSRKQSSPASDATTADSLALEALADYEAPDSELGDLPADAASSMGGALAVAEDGSSVDDYELDLEQDQPADEHLLHIFQQSRQPNPSSCHSALTQTGSRDQDDI